MHATLGISPRALYMLGKSYIPLESCAFLKVTTELQQYTFCFATHTVILHLSLKGEKLSQGPLTNF